jgi:hypothetical protein
VHGMLCSEKLHDVKTDCFALVYHCDQHGYLARHQRSVHFFSRRVPCSLGAMLRCCSCKHQARNNRMGKQGAVTNTVSTPDPQYYYRAEEVWKLRQWRTVNNMRANVTPPCDSRKPVLGTITCPKSASSAHLIAWW